MKLIILPIAAAAALGGCAMSDGPETTAATSAEDGRALAEALGDRVAGPAQQCVQRNTLRGNRGYGERTIVFEGPGSTLYVNRTRSACPRLQPWNAIRIQTMGNSLCSNELVQVFDPATGTEYGGCSLGEFTPYRRAG
jgi:hypothetical protein